MKVAIVGAGIVGLTTARALLLQGHEVVLFDQGPIPNTKASSFDHHRSIRYPYGTMTGYMKLVTDAFEAWERLWDSLGETFYEQTGTLLTAPGSSDFLDHSQAALAEAGHALELLAPSDVADRFPVLSTEGLAKALYLPSGGVLFAADILTALAADIENRGAEIYASTAVTSVDTQNQRVVMDEGWSVDADGIVVAAGPWTGQLLPHLASEIKPSRQIVVYLEPPLERALAWRDMPMVVEVSTNTGFYILPFREA